MDGICHWTYDESSDHYETECGQAFLFNEGSAEENNARYCIYCGKTLVPVEATDEEAE